MMKKFQPIIFDGLLDIFIFQNGINLLFYLAKAKLFKNSIVKTFMGIFLFILK